LDSLKKILVVEDDEMNMILIKKRLLQNNFNVISAINGEEGVELGKIHLPDLILMDINLPGIDGLEATRRLKSDPKLVNTPVIALTAHNSDHYKRQAVDAGLNDYFCKPLHFQSLLKLMNRFLQ
jgi:CheY-like chemotaxis protein